MPDLADLYPGFASRFVPTSIGTMFMRTGGAGPPLLMLHGYPQTNVIYHRVAPKLAERFTLVIPDLPGYGWSVVPRSDAGHTPYTKRAVAAVMIELMEALGFVRFRLAGHDRGGRVAYRLALDHPERVERLAVLDVIPTGETWSRADHRFMLAWWHWAFLAQPAPFPETLIGADPDVYYFKGDRSRFHPDALADYLRCARDPAAIHAMCEDYRAGATYDFDLDRADRAAGRRIACPLLVLWGGRNDLEELFGDPLAVWGEWADDVRGRALDCGHYLPEEAPDETYDELRRFFGAR
jgi:haloacetate dehalogenase